MQKIASAITRKAKRLRKRGLSIPEIRLDKNTSVDVLEGRKKGKLTYGMCRVRIRKGGLLLKEFSAIINHVKNYI